MDTVPLASVVTISDGVTHGTRVDESGDVAEQLLRDAGFDVDARLVVPDEAPQISDALRSSASGRSLVVTTGGTGFGPRDVTPEATKSVLDREAPGMAELIRAAGLAHTPMAALSRGTAGTIGAALVINLPGSPKGVREGLAAVLPLIPHAVELMGGVTGAHPTGHGAPSADDGPRVDAKAVKVHGSPPCQVGNSMSIVPGGKVHGTLGCAEFDADAVAAAAEVAASGQAQTRTLTHDLGEIEVFFEPHLPKAKVLVVSATDVARALRIFLAELGYEVAFVEPRSERLAPGDPPAIASVDGIALDERAVVVMTDHDAPGVTEELATLLRSSARFIGVMGSRRHVAHYVEELRALGFGDGDLARIRSPLGLDLGGRDPAQIALSIAAGIVADAHGRDGGWLDRA